MLKIYAVIEAVEGGGLVCWGGWGCLVCWGVRCGACACGGGGCFYVKAYGALSVDFTGCLGEYPAFHCAVLA